MKWSEFWDWFEFADNKEKLSILNQVIKDNWLHSRSAETQVEILEHAPKYIVNHDKIKPILKYETLIRLGIN